MLLKKYTLQSITNWFFDSCITKNLEQFVEQNDIFFI